MHIDTLKNLPEFVPTVAKWIYLEFPHEFANFTLEGWTRQFSDSQEEACTTFVAIEDGQVLGTASLDKEDLPPRPELSPWLVSVYVLPEARARGLGSLLIQKVEDEALKQGYSRIYLHTSDYQSFYLKRGWKTLETLNYWELELMVMIRELK
jgi:GNAT superfamily N-acetyltransferase